MSKPAVCVVCVCVGGGGGWGGGGGGGGICMKCQPCFISLCLLGEWGGGRFVEMSMSKPVFWW